MNRTPRVCVGLILSAALVGCGEEPEVPPVAPPEPQVSTSSVISAINAPAEAAEAAGVNPSAPDTLPRIDLEGIEAIVAEAQAQGQVLVIDFWATWCVPCIETFPQVHEKLGELGDRVRLMSVSIDGEGREADAAAFLAKQHALTDGYFMPDPAEQERAVEGLGERWTNVVVPAILVFDPAGQLAGEFTGETFVGDVPTQIAELADALAGPAAGG